MTDVTRETYYLNMVEKWYDLSAQDSSQVHRGKKKKKERNRADVQVCQDGMRKYESDVASPLWCHSHSESQGEEGLIAFFSRSQLFKDAFVMF